MVRYLFNRSNFNVQLDSFQFIIKCKFIYETLIIFKLILIYTKLSDYISYSHTYKMNIHEQLYSLHINKIK